MITRQEAVSGPHGPGQEEKALARQDGPGRDDACRCKEASKMTPRQLLGLMMSDLAFWKRTKKE